MEKIQTLFTMRTKHRINVSSKKILGLVVLMFFLGSSKISHSFEQDPFNDNISNKVVELSKSGQCKKAWDIIWPFVLRGSNRASAELVGEITFGNISPPLLSPKKNDSVIKHEYFRFMSDLTFVINPFKFSNLESTNEKIEFKNEILSGIWSKKNYKNYLNKGCLSKSSSKLCYDALYWKSEVLPLKKWQEKFSNNQINGILPRCRGEINRRPYL
jgi:hypothetical protein